MLPNHTLRHLEFRRIKFTATNINMAVFSRGAFEALADDVEEVETSEEEVEEPVQGSPEKPKAPLSKAAKKRAARAAREADKAGESAKEVVEEIKAKASNVVTEAVNGTPHLTDQVAQAANDAVEVAKETVNSVKQSDVAATASKAASDAATVISDAAASATAVAADALKTAQASAASASTVAKDSIKNATDAASKANSATAAKANGVASSATAKAEKLADGETRPVPKSLPFKPSLPELPQAQKDLPTNRKRPTPADFTPQSPSKEVKFQDGLAPGQGKDGERIIAGVGRHPVVEPKNRNAVERTVWTFIMIFGFIRRCKSDPADSSPAVHGPPLHDPPRHALPDLGLQGGHRPLRALSQR